MQFCDNINTGSAEDFARFKATSAVPLSASSNDFPTSSKLGTFAPAACVFAIVTFVTWCAHWSQSVAPNICHEVIISASSPESQHCLAVFSSIHYDDNIFRAVSSVSAGAFASSVLLQLLLVFDAGVWNSVRTAPAICSTVINMIGFVSHISMAHGWLPIVISSFGRVVHMARLGEWLSLVPLLTLMMHTLDIRNNDDIKTVWAATLIQFMSILAGVFASFISNIYISYVLMAISVVLFSHMFHVFWRSHQRYKSYMQFLKEKTFVEDEQLRNLKVKTELQNQESAVNSSNENDLLLRHATRVANDVIAASEERMKGLGQSSYLVPETSPAIALHARGIGIKLSYNLTLHCTLSWSIIVVVHFLGVLHVISATTECVIQSLLDILSKLMYAQVLSDSYGASMGPQDVLSRLLIFEEKANASIRQYLRILCSEVQSPLACINMGVEVLQEQEAMDMEGKEMLSVARECVNDITAIIRSVQNYQEVEDGSEKIQVRPLNFKELVRHVTTAQDKVMLARRKNVMLLMAIDLRIPDLVLGDRVRLRQLINTLVDNGIGFTHCGGQAIVTAQLVAPLTGNVPLDKNATIRFSVTDEGRGYTREEVESLFRPYEQLLPGGQELNKGLGISLCISRKLAILHGGTLSVESSPGKGSTFSFEIEFERAPPPALGSQLSLLETEVLTQPTSK